MVTWNGSGTDIYGQRFNSSGEKVNAEFQVNTLTTNIQKNASVSSLNDGGFVITWESDRNELNAAYNTGYGVHAQIFDANGNPVNNEFQVNSFEVGNQVQPSITALSDGGFVIAWASSKQDWSQWGSGIYTQRYNSSGEKVNAEFQVNTYIPNDQSSPSITALVDGGFVITYQSQVPNENTTFDHGIDIYGQRYNISGEKVGDEFQVNTYTPQSQRTPNTTALSDGGFVVTWESFSHEEGATNNYDIYGQRFDSNGDMVGNEFKANTSTNGW